MQRFNLSSHCCTKVKKLKCILCIVVQSLFFIGCDTPRGVLYSEALSHIEINPDRSIQHCKAIAHPDDKKDCLLWGANQLLKANNIETAEQICAILTGSPANECAFMLAEHSEKSIYCASAGQYEVDCRLHLLNQAVRANPNKEWVELITTMGLNADERVPWTVIYRAELEQSPLNLARCEQLPQTKDCIETGKDLFHDYLRKMRDQGQLHCQQSMWPKQFQYVPHPALDMIADTYIQDLSCSG